MRSKLRCAVIGVGNMGKNHVRTYSEINSVDLVAVADLNERFGKKEASAYNAKYYRDYEEMIEKENLDIVSICVPTSLKKGYCKTIYPKSKKHKIISGPH